MEEKARKTPRKANLFEALISLGGLIAIMAVGILVFGVDPHIPMFIGVIIAAVMALYLGYAWEDIEKFMMEGITRALQSIIILSIIGILVGMWIDSGVVPSMIYYGLQILSPGIFFIACVLICSITSLATGSSWGTMGTMGLALMGIGVGLGMPAGMTAGAVLSGAYFGDKMSPLSDTTNLAPAMAGTDVMTHVKFMMLPTGLTYVVCLVFFGILGATQYHGGAADMSKVVEISQALKDNFVISPLFLLPPVIVIGAVAMKVPAIPGITLGILSAFVLGLIFQPDCTVGTLLTTGRDGFESSIGVYEVDKLLTNGGLMGMMSSISLTILAMMFGGIMEATGQLEIIVSKLLKLVKGPASLVALTEATCVLSNVTMPEQYISIVVPGRMYAEEYKKMGLHPKTLSNALEGAGTVTSALIPWNTCGVYIKDTLGLGVAEYGPWAIFNWLMPIMNIVLAVPGLTIAQADGTRGKKKAKA